MCVLLRCRDRIKKKKIEQGRFNSLCTQKFVIYATHFLICADQEESRSGKKKFFFSSFFFCLFILPNINWFLSLFLEDFFFLFRNITNLLSQNLSIRLRHKKRGENIKLLLLTCFSLPFLLLARFWRTKVSFPFLGSEQQQKRYVFEEREQHRCKTNYRRCTTNRQEKKRSCWKLAPLQPIFFLVRSSFLIRLLILSFSPPSDCPHTSLFIPQKAWVTLESHYTLRYINTNFPVAATKTTKKKKKRRVSYNSVLSPSPRPTIAQRKR